jgi:hypothetical protein
MSERAAERVETILQEHQVEPLPERTQRDIHAIVEREVEWLSE